MTSIGFIIPTKIDNIHVLERVKTNLSSIISLYPSNKIVLINDGSSENLDQLLLNKNITILNVPNGKQGKGEFLPYYYFYHNKFFDIAIIINDCCKALKRIDEISYDFEYIFYFNYHHGWGTSVCPDNVNRSKTHEDEILRILYRLDTEKSRKTSIINKYHDKHTWNCCYASMSIISHEMIKELCEKYDFDKLYDLISTRRDRMCLESIIGVYKGLSTKSITRNLALCGHMANSIVDHVVNDEETQTQPYQTIYGEYFIKESWGR